MIFGPRLIPSNCVGFNFGTLSRSDSHRSEKWRQYFAWSLQTGPFMILFGGALWKNWRKTECLIRWMVSRFDKRRRQCTSDIFICLQKKTRLFAKQNFILTKWPLDELADQNSLPDWLQFKSERVESLWGQQFFADFSQRMDWFFVCTRHVEWEFGSNIPFAANMGLMREICTNIWKYGSYIHREWLLRLLDTRSTRVESLATERRDVSKRQQSDGYLELVMPDDIITRISHDASLRKTSTSKNHPALFCSRKRLIRSICAVVDAQFVFL